MHTYACETNEGDASYSPLPVDGGFLVFSPVGVLEDEGKPNPEMGIGLSFIDCSAGTKKLIARLPYVAGPGEVQDVFWADVESGSKARVIIHSAPIRAFTGVSYGNDYFSVMVFHIEGNNLNGYLTRAHPLIGVAHPYRGEDLGAPSGTSTPAAGVGNCHFILWYSSITS